MKKQKLRKTFNLKDLEEQVINENSCIYLQRIQDHLAFHPFHLSDLNNSINEILNRRVGKYCPRFEGILCGYKNIKFLSQNGYICDDSYFIHADTEADYFLFKPATEKLLHGIVNKISKDHVGCLVHNIFNVSLPKPKPSETWIGDSLTINDEVELKITSTDFDRRLPYIKGEIVSILNKSENDETSAIEENLSLKNHKKSKKAKKTLYTSPPDQVDKESEDHENFNLTIENQASAVDKNLLMKNHKKSKKAKKTLFTSLIQEGADQLDKESNDNENCDFTTEIEEAFAVEDSFSIKDHKKSKKPRKTGSQQFGNESQDYEVFSLASDNVERDIDDDNEETDSPPKKKRKKGKS